MMICLEKTRIMGGGRCVKIGKKRNFHCTLGKKYDFWKWGEGQKYCILGKYSPLHLPFLMAGLSPQDVLSVILTTFISECQRKRNTKGKLEYERNTHNSFRRTNYVLNGKFLLISFIFSCISSLLFSFYIYDSLYFLPFTIVIHLFF